MASLRRASPEKGLARSTQNIRMKRPLDPIDSNLDPHQSKRARIAVEILARPIPALPQPVAIKPARRRARAAADGQQGLAKAHLPAPPSTHHPPPAQPAAAATAPKTATGKISPTSDHKKKAANGIRHELDRLELSAADASLASSEGQGRKLRSQEATRFKSELSAYFPDYDEVIGNDEKQHHRLNPDTPIVVVDSRPSAPHNTDRATPQPRQLLSSARASSPSANREPAPHHDARPHRSTPAGDDDEYPIRNYSDALFTGLHDSQRVQLAAPGHEPGREIDESLPDSYYEHAHKKAERLEKSIRNTERGRAQHEKDQIVRLLNELQGQDWLRTMGVNGVTETRKKTFEPAREHFIKGCQAILDKFRAWTEEEKKQKRERDLARAEAAESAEEEEDEDAEQETEEEIEEDEVEVDLGGNEEDEEGEDEEDEEDEEEAEEDEEDVEEGDEIDVQDEDMPDAESDGDVSDGDPPDFSIDASIAQQLHEESAARQKSMASISLKRPRGELPPARTPEPYVPQREFKSFFRQKHQRDAALSKRRRSGRSVMAWGQPIEELEEYDFDLPEEYRDEETLKIRERRKRRDRRGVRSRR